MYRLIVKNTPQITCLFTKDDWELFDVEGVDRVVNDLNFQFETFVNAGYSKNEVRKHMHNDMATYSGYGTCDTEPMAHLEDALNEIFGGL